MFQQISMRSVFSNRKALLQLLRGQDGSLATFTKVLARVYGSEVAIRLVGEQDTLFRRSQWTFEELERDIQHLAVVYKTFGVVGKHVAIALPNQFSIFIHMIAISRCGGTPIPMNARLKQVDVQNVLDATQTEVIVTTHTLKEEFELETQAERGLSFLFVGETPPSLQDFSLDKRMNELEKKEVSFSSRNKETVMLCTSGTTGTPKAAVLSGKGLLKQAGLLLLAPKFLPGREQRNMVVASLPMAHIMGISITISCLFAGATLLFSNFFEPKKVIHAIETFHPNVFVGVPTMFASLQENGATKRNCKSIQIWVSAADKMPTKRAHFFQDIGASGVFFGKSVGRATFVDIYGMVELCGPMAIRVYPPHSKMHSPLPSFSFVLPGFEIRIVDEEKKTVSWGKTGLLEVKGTSVLNQYFANESDTLTEDGWFSTGDFAKRLPGNLFQLVGRNNERLKVNGFSVFPAEVEEVIRKHKMVQDVLVVGIPDDRMGEMPVALIIPKNESIDVHDLNRFIQTEVSGYRKPRQILVVESFPKGNNNKLNRREATLQTIRHFQA